MLVRDRTGALRAVWFNQPFLADVFHPHQRVVLCTTKLELSAHGLQLQNPQYEIVRAEGDDETSTARLRHRPTPRPAHRPHRADLRKDRHADDQDAAGAGVSGAGAASGRTVGSTPRRGSPARAPHGSAPCAGGRALPAGRHQPRGVERSARGAPAPHLRRVLLLSAGHPVAATTIRRGSEGQTRRHHRGHSRVRTPRARSS